MSTNQSVKNWVICISGFLRRTDEVNNYNTQFLRCVALRGFEMDQKQILVTGFPNGTGKAQLMIYFQSERDSGGGDVEKIEIHRGRAYITFDEARGVKYSFTGLEFFCALVAFNFALNNNTLNWFTFIRVWIRKSLYNILKLKRKKVCRSVVRCGSFGSLRVVRYH